MNALRHVVWPAYLVSVAMIAIPLADVATTLYPWNFADARWRFGALGMLSNAFMIPLAGLLVAFATAIVVDHRLLRRVIGIVGFVAAALSVAALAMFALDALQTRAAVRPEMKLSFNVASVTAAVKTLLAGATLLAFGVAGWRSSAAKPTARGVPLFATQPAGATSARQ